MKDVPEIAPEIRGLLEEIVADPRSKMRLAPRRALREWFDTGETVRAREMSGTKAERHLIEVHREAVAELLREAAMIAYWKAPVLAHRPTRANGEEFNPVDFEPEWREKARTHVRPSPQNDSAVHLLAGCLNGLAAGQAYGLATASLSLAGNDTTRCVLGLSVPWERPRSALSLFRRLSNRRLPYALADRVFLCLGARLCALGMFDKAREEYSRAAQSKSAALYGRIYTFSLSCFLGDEVRACEEARELGVATKRADDDVILAGRDLLKKWVRTRKQEELNRAKRLLNGIDSRLPAAARLVSRAFAS